MPSRSDDSASEAMYTQMSLATARVYILQEPSSADCLGNYFIENLFF